MGISSGDGPSRADKEKTAGQASQENGRFATAATAATIGPIIPVDPAELERQARIHLREKAREEQRREHQRLAEVLIQQTQLQMHELQQQLASAQRQQDQVIMSFISPLSSDSAPDRPPNKVRRRSTQELTETRSNSRHWNIPPSRADEKEIDYSSLDDYQQSLVQEYQNELQQAGNQDDVGNSLSEDEEVEGDLGDGSSSSEDEDEDLNTDEEDDEPENDMAVEVEEEEKKETDIPSQTPIDSQPTSQGALISRHPPPQTSSQKSNAMPPRRRSTLEESNSSTRNSVEQWRQRRNETMPTSHAVPEHKVQGSQRKLSNENLYSGRPASLPRNVRRRRSSSLTEMDRWRRSGGDNETTTTGSTGDGPNQESLASFFDLDLHREKEKRRASEPNNQTIGPAVAGIIRRRHTAAGFAEDNEQNRSELTSHLRSLQQSQSLQQGLFEQTIDMILQESESMASISSINDPVSQHRRRMAEEPSPVEQSILQQHQRTTLNEPVEPEPPEPPPPPSPVCTPNPPVFQTPRELSMSGSPKPTRTTQKKSLLDMGFNNDFFEDEEEDEEDEKVRLRRQQNALHLSSSWNDLFSSSSASVAQTQLSIPRRRGSFSSDSDGVLQFESEDNGDASEQKLETVEDLEKEARPNLSLSMFMPQDDLLHLSGSLTEFFVHDEDDDNDAFDENYNKSLDALKNLGRSSLKNGTGAVGSNSESSMDRDAGLDPHNYNSAFWQLQGSGSSNMSMFDYFSHSSDDPSKMLNKFQESMSQFTEVTGVNAGTLMQHLSKQRGKPSYRWDARSGSKSGSGTSGTGGTGGTDVTGNSSHHGQTTITSTSTSLGSSRHRGTNPMKELRKSQHAKRKSEVNSKGHKHHRHSQNTVKSPQFFNQDSNKSGKSSSNIDNQKTGGGKTENGGTAKAKPQGRKSTRGSLGEHFEKSNGKLLEPGVEPNETSTSKPVVEKKLASLSPDKKGQGRRLPRRERRLPGRTRSRSLSDLQRLKNRSRPAATADKAKMNPFNVEDEDEKTATSTTADDPKISHYKSLVGNLLQQEQSSQAVKKGADVAKEDNDQKEPGPGRMHRPTYNRANLRSRRRASYDWMQHPDRPAKDNMLALVGQDVLVKDQDSMDDKAPKRGGLERQRSSSITNLVIVVQEGWDADDDPDYNWTRFNSPDPILTSDSVMHFTGVTPSRSISDGLQQEESRRDMLTSSQTPSFSSRSSGSVDVAAKKPVRRYTAMVQKVEDQVAKDAALHASYDWIHHSQIALSNDVSREQPETEERLLRTTEETGSNMNSDEVHALVDERKARSSLGAYLSASQASRSTEDIEKIFDWTAALHKGDLDKSTVVDSTANKDSHRSCSDMPSSVGAASTDVNARKLERYGTKDHVSAPLDTGEDNSKQVSMLSGTAGSSDDEGQVDKRHSLEDYIENKALTAKVLGSTADLSITPSVNTGVVAIAGSNAAMATLASGEPEDNKLGEVEILSSPIESKNQDGKAQDWVGVGASATSQKHTPEVKDKRDASKDRGHRGVQRTRSRSLTHVGRTGQRGKDEKPRASKQQASMAGNQSAMRDDSKDSRGLESTRVVRPTRSKSLTKFSEEENASERGVNTDTSKMSRRSRESMSKSRTIAHSGGVRPDGTRGRHPENGPRDRRRSRSGSMTDMDQLRDKDVGKNTQASRRESMASGGRGRKTPDKENHRRPSRSKSSDMKKGHKSLSRLNKTTHQGPRQNKNSKTSSRLGTSLHVKLADASTDDVAMHTREGVRPELRKHRSSSLSDVEGIDKARHGRSNSARPKESTTGSVRRSQSRGSAGHQIESVQPRRRRPERQRSRSLTDTNRYRGSGNQQPETAEEGSPPVNNPTGRPSMLSYDWQLHSTSTTSMMSNSSKPQRDRRSMLVRTRSQSLSSLFGDKTRGHTPSDVSTDGSKAGSAVGYNWSNHGRADDTSPRSKRRGLDPSDGMQPANSSAAGYDWNIHQTLSSAQNAADGGDANGNVDRRGLLSRSSSRSLTNLNALSNMIEESPFENSDRSKASLEASWGLAD